MMLLRYSRHFCHIPMGWKTLASLTYIVSASMQHVDTWVGIQAREVAGQVLLTRTRADRMQL